MALCRLLDRQGLLKGDLNVLRQLALQTTMSMETREAAEMESYRFKSQMVIAHPEMADKIFKEEQEDDFMDGVEEIEELDVKDPEAAYSENGLDKMLGSLKDFGFYVEDINGD